MKTRQQTEQELRDVLKTARQSDGYMVTIHRRQGQKLTHWSGTVEYKNDDIPQSLFAVIDARGL